MVGGSLMFPGIVRDLLARESALGSTGADPLIPRAPHFTPKAKRVIYLHMVGGPSQLDLFDYKPQLQEHYGHLGRTSCTTS